MKKFTASNVYITSHTFLSLYSNPNEEHLLNFLNELDLILKEYKNSSNISLYCASDLLEYPCGVDNTTLSDVILEMSGNDSLLLGFYLDSIEKSVSSIKSNIPSEPLLNKLNKPVEHFPRGYLLDFKQGFDVEFDDSLKTKNWFDTLNKNSKYIIEKHRGKEQFIKWSKENYNNIDFHSDVLATLDTIISGTYYDFKVLISDSLNALNQASYILSADPQQNERDLDKIMEYTAKIGRRLTCTRQGSNKPKFSFSLDAGNDKATEIINCEYHLKINWNDKGIRLVKENYVRIYFGMRFYSHLSQKKIKVAHIGKHL